MMFCEECKKKLGFFEGHYHPTLGKKSLVCGSCFVQVEESVVRWKNFVLSNSFNPELSTQTLSVNWNSLFNKFTGIKKQFIETKEKNSNQTLRKKSSSKVVLNQLNYHNNDTFVQLGGKNWLIFIGVIEVWWMKNQNIVWNS